MVCLYCILFWIVFVYHNLIKFIYFLDYLTKEFGFDIDDSINSGKSNNDGK